MRKFFILITIMITTIISASLPSNCIIDRYGLTFVSSTDSTITITATDSLVTEVDIAIGRQVGSTWLFWNPGTLVWTNSLSASNQITYSGSSTDITVKKLTKNTSYQIKCINMSSFPGDTCSESDSYIFTTSGTRAPIWLKGDSLLIYQRGRFGNGLFNFDFGDSYDSDEPLTFDPTNTTDNIGTCNRPWDTLFISTIIGPGCHVFSDGTLLRYHVDSTYRCTPKCYVRNDSWEGPGSYIFKAQTGATFVQLPSDTFTSANLYQSNVDVDTTVLVALPFDMYTIESIRFWGTYSHKWTETFCDPHEYDFRVTYYVNDTTTCTIEAGGLADTLTATTGTTSWTLDGFYIMEFNITYDTPLVLDDDESYWIKIEGMNPVCRFNWVTTYNDSVRCDPFIQNIDTYTPMSPNNFSISIK